MGAVKIRGGAAPAPPSPTHYGRSVIFLRTWAPELTPRRDMGLPVREEPVAPARAAAREAALAAHRGHEPQALRGGAHPARLPGVLGLRRQPLCASLRGLASGARSGRLAGNRAAAFGVRSCEAAGLANVAATLPRAPPSQASVQLKTASAVPPNCPLDQNCEIVSCAGLASDSDGDAPLDAALSHARWPSEDSFVSGVRGRTPNAQPISLDDSVHACRSPAAHKGTKIVLHFYLRGRRVAQMQLRPILGACSMSGVAG